MESQVKVLSILGSTGSIGRQTLDVVAAFPQRFPGAGADGQRFVGRGRTPGAPVRRTLRGHAR